MQSKIVWFLFFLPRKKTRERPTEQLLYDCIVFQYLLRRDDVDLYAESDGESLVVMI